MVFVTNLGFLGRSAAVRTAKHEVDNQANPSLQDVMDTFEAVGFYGWKWNWCLRDEEEAGSQGKNGSSGRQALTILPAHTLRPTVGFTLRSGQRCVLVTPSPEGELRFQLHLSYPEG